MGLFGASGDFEENEIAPPGFTGRACEATRDPERKPDPLLLPSRLSRSAPEFHRICVGARGSNDERRAPPLPPLAGCTAGGDLRPAPKELRAAEDRRGRKGLSKRGATARDHDY
jgi:hypothetical protein